MLPADSPRTALIVLTTPRSGRSWTASLMRSTETMGVCREWLTRLIHPNAQSRSELPPDGAHNGEVFLTNLREAAGTRNGVFAIKIISSIWYEEMLGDPVPTVRAFARLAGRDIPLDHHFATDLRIQRDDATNAIRKLFERDLASAKS